MMTNEQLKLEKIKMTLFGRTLTIRLTYVILRCSVLCFFCRVSRLRF
jgi:hypothetical protein